MRLLINAAIMGALFYFWQVEGVAGAGNVMVMLGWVWAILMTMVFWAIPVMPPYRRMVGLAYGVLLAFAFAWVGHVWLAGFTMTARLLAYCAQCPRKEKAE